MPGWIFRRMYYAQNLNKTIGNIVSYYDFSLVHFASYSDAIENPYPGHGNEILSAFDSLCFLAVWQL